MEDTTLDHNDILSFAYSKGFSRKKIKNLREAGLFPSPCKRIGLGRGRGVTWIYPPSTKDKIILLDEMIKKYRIYDEVRWRLWTRGDTNHWSTVKAKLIESYPSVPPMVDEMDFAKFEGSFLRFIRKFSVRHKIFNSLQMRLLWPVTLYLVFPIIFGQEYDGEDITRSDLQTFFSKETVIIHEKLVEKNIYDPRLWDKTLQDASPHIGEKLSKIFILLDNDLDKTENRLLKRILHSRVPPSWGKTTLLWKIRSILAGLLSCLLEENMETT